ncbi:substrate-binding periplasmic protein [sulfur-oxidizing endosymbiont of Gigantopelta aegis]|uniref:substrate-binding periplasmic protein n=1 Tax=sulfur-oxidizing endosymbiont of Gigantopelta aegis TaxID=2794934 RepID=UPI0018DEACC6|nr:transporter substrate-binding domain-containing protein [sulfur-oxidizing endosymbiont of Gigantopelta aegis]
MKISTTFYIAGFCAIFSFLAPLYASEHNGAQTPTIMLNDTNKEPFTNNNKDGFFDLILAEIFQAVGYQLKTVHLPPERGLLSANDGIVDGEVNRIINLESTYPNLIRVPEKIRDSDFCALSLNPTIINTPEVLNKKVVGHIKGWKIYDKMMRDSKQVITVSSPQQLLRLLKLQRIDVALYTCVEGLALAKQLNIQQLKILKPSFIQVGMYIYLNKRHVDLVPKLSQALHAIKKNGRYGQLYQEKIRPYYVNE